MSYLTTKLYKHQSDCVDKLHSLKGGAISADIGTGKTLIILAIFEKKLLANKVKKLMILCPINAKYNLQNEVKKHSKFTDEIEIFGIDSIGMSDRIFLEVYNKINQDYMLVIDESHYIKNHKAIRTKRAIQLSEKVNYRYIMTGTNITNHVSDLYSQFYFLSYKILGYDSWYKFRANHLEYCKVTNRVFKSHNIDYLSQKISPYTYQCNINDVLELPELSINDVYYEVSEDTKNSYHKIKEKIINEYIMLDDSATNFVYLLFTKLQMEVTKDNNRADYCLNLIQEMNINKVIVWCKYNHEIEILSEILEQNNISYSIFNGQYKQLDDFKQKTQVLLANIQTGGVSHNMQFCSHAIYYSSSFNYAGMRQSQGRIYRSGQQKKCLVYYIKSSMKIEKLIFKSLAKKSDLLQDFIKLTQRFNKEWLTQYLQDNL